MSLRVAAWPPGALECTYTSPHGAVKRSVRFPWGDWVPLALFAAADACAVAVLLRRRAVPRAAP